MVGTRYATISVWVLFVVRRVLYNSKNCRDTLTNRLLWTEICAELTFMYKYELNAYIYSASAVLFSDTTCIYVPTPRAPGMLYKAQSCNVDKYADRHGNIGNICA